MQIIYDDTAPIQQLNVATEKDGNFIEAGISPPNVNMFNYTRISNTTTINSVKRYLSQSKINDNTVKTETTNLLSEVKTIFKLLLSPI